MPEPLLLDIDDVCKRIDPKKPLNRVTVWRWIKAGNFPEPVRIGKRVRWTDDAVTAWLAERGA